MRLINKVKNRQAVKLTINSERWILPYADLLTLLFALFVVMYTLFSFEEPSDNAFIHKLKKVFYDEPKQYLGLKILPSASNSSMASPVISPALALLAKQPTTIFQVRQYSSWYELELKSDLLFESGLATLKPQAKDQLKKIANNLIDEKAFSIIIEGYSDNHPINTLEFSSNWLLSSARAAKVAEALAYFGLNLQPLAVVSYADQYPIASNKSKEGRAKNRRIVIIVAKQSSKRRLQPLLSKIVLARDPNKIEQTTKVNIMKEVKTPSGGIKFIKSIELRSKKENK